LHSGSCGELILGVDPGSIRTGFGLIRKFDGKISHVAHGTIVLDRRRALSERMRELATDLAQLVARYEPHHVVVEDVFYFKNARSALILGQARGVVLAVLGLHGLRAQTLTPTEAKSLVSGFGRAKKFQIAKLVAMELSIAMPASEDASDALALALAHAYKTGH